MSDENKPIIEHMAAVVKDGDYLGTAGQTMADSEDNITYESLVVLTSGVMVSMLQVCEAHNIEYESQQEFLKDVINDFNERKKTSIREDL